MALPLDNQTKRNFHKKGFQILLISFAALVVAVVLCVAVILAAISLWLLFLLRLSPKMSFVLVNVVSAAACYAAVVFSAVMCLQCFFSAVATIVAVLSLGGCVCCGVAFSVAIVLCCGILRRCCCCPRAVFVCCDVLSDCLFGLGVLCYNGFHAIFSAIELLFVVVFLLLLSPCMWCSL